jgi:hypothetical protein
VFGDFCEQEFKAFSRFSLQACFLKLIFSKLPQELPLVALVQHEKISLSCTRLFITIGARDLC